MKTFSVLFTLVLFLSVNSVSMAQQRQESIRTNQRQVQIETMASPDIQLLFPESKAGVVYQNNRAVERTLNYNVLLELFFYTDRRGQQVWINPETADSVRIGEEVFHYVPGSGYFMAVAGEPSGRLYLQFVVDISTETVAVGAYGTADHSASVDVVRVLPGGAEGDYASRTFSLENPSGQQLQIMLKREDRYHFLKDGLPVDISNRRILQRNFSHHRSDLRTFLRRNSIDFDNREHMMSLAEFLVSLGE